MQSSLSGLPAQNSVTDGKNSFQRRRLGSGSFQAEVFEKISHGVFRFGDAIGHENEAVAGFHLAARAFESRIGEQSHRHVPMRRTNHFSGANQQRRHVAAVHVFEFAIAPQAHQQHGRIFFADKLLGEEAVDRRHHIEQRHARTQMRIDHPLQGRGQQCGRNSLAADVGQHHGQTFFGVDGVKEVSADFFTRQVLAAQRARTALRESSPASAAAECWPRCSTPVGSGAILLRPAPAAHFRSSDAASVAITCRMSWPTPLISREAKREST